MMLLEPVTAITDLLLSLLAAGLGWGMVRRFRRTGMVREALWAWGFGALAVSTLLGAVVHGVPLGALRDPTWFAVWLTAALSYGCFVLAALFAVLGGREASRLAPPVVVGLGFLFWQSHVVADQLVVYEAVCLTIGTLLYLYRRARTGEQWLLAVPLGSLIVVAGAVLQRLGVAFTILWYFSPNDVFHLATLVALPWYYLGADPALLEAPSERTVPRGRAFA